jgi:hypothetical protein
MNPGKFDVGNPEKTAKLQFLGEELTFYYRDSKVDAPICALFLAMLALDDERINQVFEAFELVVLDSRGTKVWPHPKKECACGLVLGRPRRAPKLSGYLQAACPKGHVSTWPSDETVARNAVLRKETDDKGD